jgi:AcrR family transcriptional regulator
VAGLREHKRALTERAIVDAAMELFVERGFAATTVEDIATAAGVGRRTLFRYFPTKEDIVLDPRRIDRGYAFSALREQRAGKDEVELVMRVLAELQRRAFAVFRAEHQHALHRLSHDEPQLAGRSFLMMQAARDVIVEALLPKRASRKERLRVQLLAMACIVAVDASVTIWVEGGMKEDLAQVLAEATAHLRRGFAAPSTVEHAGGRSARSANMPQDVMAG